MTKAKGADSSSAAFQLQDTLFKALIVGVLPQGKRSQAFGIFYTGYGTGWLIGSVAAGLLYERSRIALVTFAVAVQLFSLPIFAIAHRQVRHRDSSDG